MNLPNDSPYALSNPLSLLLDKPAAGFGRADFLRVIRAKGIERITFHYTGLDGKLKELKIPVADPRQADTILAEGERVDGSSLFKGMVDAAVSDLYVVPGLRTAFLNPFDDGSLDFICRYMTTDGEPGAVRARQHPGPGRGPLPAGDVGLEMRALGELEFFLMCDKTSPSTRPEAARLPRRPRPSSRAARS